MIKGWRIISDTQFECVPYENEYLQKGILHKLYFAPYVAYSDTGNVSELW
jgi:hypothetical protein